MSFPPPYFKWRPHPWHGLDIGADYPGQVNAYIEMTPFSLVKYEITKRRAIFGSTDRSEYPLIYRGYMDLFPEPTAASVYELL